MAEIIIPQFNPAAIPTSAPPPSWKEIREALARIAQVAAPKARIHARWQLKFKLGETVALLRSDKEAANEKGEKRAHAWMISVADAIPGSLQSGGGGMQANQSAGVNFDVTLRLNVWGFLEHRIGDDESNSQDELEAEAEMMMLLFALNRSRLALDDASGLQEVSLLKFEEIDLVGFGSTDVHVAPGSMTIRLNEQIIPVQA